MTSPELNWSTTIHDSRWCSAPARSREPVIEPSQWPRRFERLPGDSDARARSARVALWRLSGGRGPALLLGSAACAASAGPPYQPVLATVSTLPDAGIHLLEDGDLAVAVSRESTAESRTRVRGGIQYIADGRICAGETSSDGQRNAYCIGRE